MNDGAEESLMSAAAVLSLNSRTLRSGRSKGTSLHYILDQVAHVSHSEKVAVLSKAALLLYRNPNPNIEEMQIVPCRGHAFHV